MGAAALAVGLSLAGTDAVSEVIRAKRLVVSVTTAHEPCSAPDTTSGGTGTPACTAPLPADPVCRLGLRGRGKVVLRGVQGDVNMLARMDSIDPACEGETLQVRMSFRVTANDCAGQTCTLVDFVDHVMGNCEVSGGTCRLQTTLNTAIPDLVVTTNESHVELLGCDFKRTTGPSLPTRTFACGIMIP
jgi:hypothetical protein